MNSGDHTPTLESAIPSHLLRADRAPKHKPGTYTPPYPSFSARFDEHVTAVVMAYFGVQARDPRDPKMTAALDEMRRKLGLDGGPIHWDRAEYVDAEGFYTVISIAYWDEPSVFESWYENHAEFWTAPEGV